MIHLLVSVGSLLIGLFQKWMDNKHKRETARDAAAFRDVQAAREVNDDWFKWTRRVITLSCVFFILAVPSIASFYGLPIWYGYIEQNGFITSLFSGDTSITWKRLPDGLVIFPIQIYMVEAAFGLYFGRK